MNNGKRNEKEGNKEIKETPNDEIINEIENQNISNLNSFIHMQQEPEPFDKNKENNYNYNIKVKEVEGKMNLFNKQMLFDTFKEPSKEIECSNPKEEIQNEKNDNDNINQNTIDYSNLSRNEKKNELKNEKLDMFLKASESKSSMEQSILSQDNTHETKKSKLDNFLFENDNIFNYSKMIGKAKKNNIKSRSNYMPKRIDKTNNKINPLLSNEGNSYKYNYNPVKTQETHQIIQNSYLMIMKNRNVTNRQKKGTSSLEKIKYRIKPVNLIKKENNNLYIFSNENKEIDRSKSNNNTSHIYKTPIKNKNFQMQRRLNSFNKKIKKSKTSNKKININKSNNNNSVIELLDNIKLKYKNQEKKFIQKEQDLLSEIKILREKINHFSLNEMNYQIEIEKLKRKKKSASSFHSNFDEQQTSILKISDNSIELPKDLNYFDQFGPSINTSSINVCNNNNNSNIKMYKSFFKLFRQFNLNKTVFCSQKEENDFIDDKDEVNYDAVFSNCPQLKNFIHLLVNQLRKETESRLLLEEKTLKILSNDIKTIDNLEKKLKQYEKNASQRRRQKLNLNTSTTNGNVSQTSIKSCDLYI